LCVFTSLKAQTRSKTIQTSPPPKKIPNHNLPTTVKLNDGSEIPIIAFGTGSEWFRRDATEYVEQALESGFDHIDTAAIYGNEDSVRTAIRESGLSREELYITTKYDGGDIQESIRASLIKLGLKSVNLYLVHFPSFIEKDMEGAWKEFEKIKDDGLSTSIGVSNFNVEQLQTIIKTARIKPAVNQIRFHPYNYATQKAVVEYGAKYGIVTEGYSGLTSLTKNPGGPVDAVVSTIAVRLNATPAQVLLKWVRAKGVVVVTTTSKKERLAEYLAVEHLPPLTPAEIAAIDAAGAKGPPPSALKMLPVTIRALWPTTSRGSEAIYEIARRMSELWGVCAAAFFIGSMVYCLGRGGWIW